LTNLSIITTVFSIMKKLYSPVFILGIGLKKTFSKLYSWALTVFIALNVLLLYYFLLIQKTTWNSFWQSNTAFYSWSQIVLSIINAVLIGASVSMLIKVIKEKKKASRTSYFQTFASLLFLPPRPAVLSAALSFFLFWVLPPL